MKGTEQTNSYKQKVYEWLIVSGERGTGSDY